MLGKGGHLETQLKLILQQCEKYIFGNHFTLAIRIVSKVVGLGVAYNSFFFNVLFKFQHY